MNRPSLSGTAVILALAACAEPAPPPPPTLLGPATDTVVVPVVQVVSATWLGGDRWASLAVTEARVDVVDFVRRTTAPLTRNAGQLSRPSIVFRAGDTLYIGDWGLRRLSLWSLDGGFVRAMPAPDALRGALPSGRDVAGRFLFELAPLPGRDGSGNRDSAAVVRTAADFSSPDTVARLAPLEVAEVIGDAGHRFERRVLSGHDEWGVAAEDGSIWVARVYDNRVDWLDPGGNLTGGRPLPDRVLTVTQADRDAFLAQFPPELRATAEQLPFAIVKPPFEAGFSGPGSTVWLEKSRAAIDSVRQVQVVDRQGGLARVYEVPSRGRVVGVAPGALVVAEQFKEGVRLLRFRLP
ncbi:MAG: hypothetical protein ACOY71_06245 [Gemmatimonadota bacterium]